MREFWWWTRPEEGNQGWGCSVSTVGRRVEQRTQVGVFLSYATGQGRVLQDRELYLTQGWSEDWERRREAGVSEGVRFQTKPQLAQKMVKRAAEGGVPFRWFAGDTVYGNDRRLRRWLEEQDMGHQGTRSRGPGRRKAQDRCGRTGWRPRWRNRTGRG